MRKLSHEEIPRADPREIISLPRHPIQVMVHDVRSIHNVGSIFRTSDAAAVDHIHLTGYTGTPDHPAIHRTALGAQDVVPWRKHDDVLEAISELKSVGITLAALEITDEPSRFHDLEFRHFPLCLIVGNEVEGIPQHVLDQCDLALEIPQFGMKQSLNVAVAFGVAVYGIVERYRQLRLGAKTSDP